ncbi:hypothetical protein [Mesorhizobium sp. M0047]|uniref:hypothetical protein n=1 Tax=Mesorhizobium sp. M0047 TaxID=2956859 RepID=UPI003335012A
MSAIVNCTDRQSPGLLKDTAAGPAGRAFKPNHRWKVLGIGVAANASFSATFAGIPATAVVLRQGIIWPTPNSVWPSAFWVWGLRSANCHGVCSPIAGVIGACF